MVYGDFEFCLVEVMAQPVGAGDGGDVVSEIFCRTIPEAGSHATRRTARPDGVLRERPGQDGSCHGGEGCWRYSARSGAHRRGGGQGRADLSGQCGSPAQGGCHTHPKAFHAGRGGCHRIGCGQEEVRPSFGAASRRTKRSARSCGGSQMPCGCNSATISCAPCCGPRVGRSRRHLRRRQHQAALESVGRTVHSSNR